MKISWIFLAITAWRLAQTIWRVDVVPVRPSLQRQVIHFKDGSDWQKPISKLRKQAWSHWDGGFLTLNPHYPGFDAVACTTVESPCLCLSFLLLSFFATCVLFRASITGRRACFPCTLVPTDGKSYCLYMQQIETVIEVDLSWLQIAGREPGVCI